MLYFQISMHVLMLFWCCSCHLIRTLLYVVFRFVFFWLFVDALVIFVRSLSVRQFDMFFMFYENTHGTHNLLYPVIDAFVLFSLFYCHVFLSMFLFLLFVVTLLIRSICAFYLHKIFAQYIL